MGLDMFLSAKCANCTIEDAAYWRKANAIHGWFIRNLCEGKDDCKEYFVSRSIVTKLLSDCYEAIKSYKNKDLQKCRKILPPIEGFFFGNYEIDEGWEQDINDTINSLIKWSNPKYRPDINLYYRASW